MKNRDREFNSRKGVAGYSAGKGRCESNVEHDVEMQPAQTIYSLHVSAVKLNSLENVI